MFIYDVFSHVAARAGLIGRGEYIKYIRFTRYTRYTSFMRYIKMLKKGDGTRF